MRSSPYMVESDSSGEMLQPLDESEGQYTEQWLQELLRKQPDILPVAEIEPVFHPLIPIGREVVVGTGAVDNLFISHRGYLVLVETKLWRNPEAKREVVAQAIDYASSISKWHYTNLDEITREYTQEYADHQYNLLEWVVKQRGHIEGGHEFFEETVDNSLRLGRFLVLIVGDRIRPSVVDMLEYMNRRPHLSTDIALVQLNCYKWRSEADWPLFVVPNIVARTKIVERSVIEVTILPKGDYQITAKQEGGTTGGRRPPTLTEEAFWQLLQEHSPESLETARKLIDTYRDKEGIEVETRESSIVVVLDIQDSGQQASLFFINKRGILQVWPGTTSNQLARAGITGGPAEWYTAQMREILRMDKGRKDFSRRIPEVNIQEVITVVDTFIEKIRLAEHAH